MYLTCQEIYQVKVTNIFFYVNKNDLPEKDANCNEVRVVTRIPSH